MKVKKVKEIEIFEITLKHKDLSKDILKTIDKFIPYANTLHT